MNYFFSPVYVFKKTQVETKELLEHHLVLMYQEKMNRTCIPSMTSQEMKLMQGLKWTDRQLVALQHDHIVLPSIMDPYTTDSKHLQSALEHLQPILKKLVSIRDGIMPLPGMPHPCLMWKLVESATIMQQKIAIFKRILMSQISTPMMVSEARPLEEICFCFYIFVFVFLVLL